MVSTIARSYSKENGLMGFLKGAIKDTGVKEPLAEGYRKLPTMPVPRPHLSAAGLLPLWDLFQDDQSGLGVAVLKDGSYRCCFELDGVHVSGFDEVRLVSLMNHFTGFLNAIDTSVQLSIVCHNISKREYFRRHPVEVADDEFLKYVARVVENDEAFLLSKNFIPELKFYVTFSYRPPKEKKPSKQSWVDRVVGNISDVFTNQAARQTVGNHQKNVMTMIQRANGYISQLGACGMSGRAISAEEYFKMLYRELNPRTRPVAEADLPTPMRPVSQSLPPGLRRIFPDAEPATIRAQLIESRYDFTKPDYVFVADESDIDEEKKE